MTELQERYKKECNEMSNSHHEEKCALLSKFAEEYARTNKYVSISGVQRCFLIGYNQAAREVERLEMNELVTKPDHHGKRVSLCHD